MFCLGILDCSFASKTWLNFQHKRNLALVANLNQLCLEELNRIQIRLMLISVDDDRHDKLLRVLRCLYKKFNLSQTLALKGDLLSAKNLLESAYLPFKTLCNRVAQEFPEFDGYKLTLDQFASLSTV